MKFRAFLSLIYIFGKDFEFMKRFCVYASIFAFSCVVFGAGYYRSYQRAYEKFVKNSAKDGQTDEILKNAGIEIIENAGIIKEASVSGDENAEDKQQTAEAFVDKPDDETEVLSSFSKVLAGAKMKIENYNLSTGESTFSEGYVPADFVGLTRKELIGEIYGYMIDMPLEEYEKGLYSYEITYFSNRELVLKKSYNPELVTFKYYVAVKDGYVIVYRCDMETVYEYTSIVAAMLPEKERNRLMAGIYLKTNDELYELLENYSS